MARCFRPTPQYGYHRRKSSAAHLVLRQRDHGHSRRIQRNRHAPAGPQAEAEGLDKIFLAAGFEWREPGCSMCLAMNPDKLAVGERSASTSNRNFEGRQGRGGRTHLVSPAVAAATAVAGHLAAPADLD